MHPWKKIIRGKRQVEETTTCFMCLKRVTNIKMEKHMTKIHAATCPKEKLNKMCREAEEKLVTEGLNFDEIIDEEKERQETLKEKRMEGLSGMFKWKQEPKQEGHDTVILKCYLCQGNWTGTNKQELTDHLEKAHKVVFQIKELIELSESQPDELEPAATADEDERLLAVPDTIVDENTGKKWVNI